ncbi:Ctr copper transporter family-domain-containing protein [Myxozyma melibiosi]|uniref:Copper transport protein n=1 Tax=Myxozyma melibiosi TaxID=54550 RepID=A0ABR1F5T3_9ASCO
MDMPDMPDMPGMDHGGMDHGGMDHGGMGHGGMDMGSGSCKMNMIFNSGLKDICIVFEWWHIRSGFSAFVSLLAVVALGVGYEYLRTLATSRLLNPKPTSVEIPLLSDMDRDSDDESVTESSGSPTAQADSDSLNGANGEEMSTSSTLVDLEATTTAASRKAAVSRSKYGAVSSYLDRTSRSFIQRHARFFKALMYAVQVVYSFFIMLIAMTYNCWIIIAVGVGAFIGHLTFGSKSGSTAKGMSCH